MIEHTFAEFATARGGTLRLVDGLTQAQLDFSPRSGRWSVGEVLDHLLRAEALYRGELEGLVELARAGARPYLRRTFRDVNVAPLFMPDFFLPMFDIPFSIMNRFIPDSVKSFVTEYPLMPMRNPDVATPRRGRQGAALRDDLTSSLEQTRNLLVSNADLDFTQMISEHPLVGAVTGPQILHFLALHERRHQKQMERVRADPRFPAA